MSGHEMNVKDMIALAKLGDCGAVEMLLELYRPLMLKESIIDGELDEDLFQELQIVFMHCVQRFRI